MSYYSLFDGAIKIDKSIVEEHDKQIRAEAFDDMENSLIRNSRTEYIDGEIHLIVTEDRIKLIAEQLKEQNK